jgi:hypothetical protein
MTNHIYGRKDMALNPSRPHMFIKELQLYVDYLKEEVRNTFNPGPKDIKGWNRFCNNLLDGVTHYKELAEQKLIKQKEAFEEGLSQMESTVLEIRTQLTNK